MNLNYIVEEFKNLIIINDGVKVNIGVKVLHNTLWEYCIPWCNIDLPFPVWQMYLEQ